MSSNDEQLQIIVRAVDEATQTLKAVQSLVSTMGGSAEETATKVSKMSGAMSVLGQIGTGILRQIGVDVWNEIANAVGMLVDAIPNAVQAGYEWAQDQEA